MWHWWWRQLFRLVSPPPFLETTTTQVNQFILSDAVCGRQTPAVRNLQDSAEPNKKHFIRAGSTSGSSYCLTSRCATRRKCGGHFVLENHVLASDSIGCTSAYVRLWYKVGRKNGKNQDWSVELDNKDALKAACFYFNMLQRFSFRPFISGSLIKNKR